MTAVLSACPRWVPYQPPTMGDACVGSEPSKLIGNETEREQIVKWFHRWTPKKAAIGEISPGNSKVRGNPVAGKLRQRCVPHTFHYSPDRRGLLRRRRNGNAARTVRRAGRKRICKLQAQSMPENTLSWNQGVVCTPNSDCKEFRQDSFSRGCRNTNSRAAECRARVRCRL